MQASGVNHVLNVLNINVEIYEIIVIFTKALVLLKIKRLYSAKRFKRKVGKINS